MHTREHGYARCLAHISGMLRTFCPFWLGTSAWLCWHNTRAEHTALHSHADVFMFSIAQGTGTDRVGLRTDVFMLWLVQRVSFRSAVWHRLMVYAVALCCLGRHGRFPESEGPHARLPCFQLLMVSNAYVMASATCSSFLWWLTYLIPVLIQVGFVHGFATSSHLVFLCVCLVCLLVCCSCSSECSFILDISSPFLLLVCFFFFAISSLLFSCLRILLVYVRVLPPSTACLWVPHAQRRWHAQSLTSAQSPWSLLLPFILVMHESAWCH